MQGNVILVSRNFKATSLLFRLGYLLAILILLGCSNQGEVILKEQDQISYPLYRGDNIHFSVLTEGKKKFELWGNNMVIHKKGKNAETRKISGNVIFHLFDQNEIKIIELYSDKLIYHDDEHLYTFQDSVFISSMEGFRLYCDTLVWDKKNGRLESNTQVRVVTKQDSISGFGFEASENISNYTVYRVTGKVNIEQ